MGRELTVDLVDVVRAHEHHRYVGEQRIVSDRNAQAQPIHLRHQQVTDDDVRWRRDRELERLGAIRRLAHVETPVTEV